MKLEVGDDVAYWTRRKGERSRYIHGKIVELSEGGLLARVKGHDTCVETHIIEVSRLRRDE